MAGTPLEDLIKEIEEWLKEAEEIVDDHPPPIPPDVLEVLATLLDDSEHHITRILTPMWIPSLNPPDAGFVNRNIDNSTLVVCATNSSDLAEAAYRQTSLGSKANHVIIGTCIKTLKFWMFPAYRELAGIG